MITDWEASAWEIEQPVVSKKSEQKWGQKYIKHKTLPNTYIHSAAFPSSERLKLDGNEHTAWGARWNCLKMALHQYFL